MARRQRAHGGLRGAPAQYTICDVLRLALGQAELRWLSEFVDVESAGRSGLAPLQPSFPTVDDAVFLCEGMIYAVGAAPGTWRRGRSLGRARRGARRHRGLRRGGGNRGSEAVENYVGSRLVWPNNVGDVEEHALLRTIVTVAFSELLRPGISS